MPVDATKSAAREVWQARGKELVAALLVGSDGFCADADAAVPPDFYRQAIGAGLAVCLATSTAYRSRPARSVIASLADRIPIGPELAVKLETALHEAVMNAVLHGNLGVSSADRCDLDSCVEQERLVAQLVDRPDVARRAILITARWSPGEIELRVEDEGAGYAEIPQSDPPAACGYGLRIIRALADRFERDAGGRRLIIGFTR